MLLVASIVFLNVLNGALFAQYTANTRVGEDRLEIFHANQYLIQSYHEKKIQIQRDEWSHQAIEQGCLSIGARNLLAKQNKILKKYSKEITCKVSDRSQKQYHPLLHMTTKHCV